MTKPVVSLMLPYGQTLESSGLSTAMRHLSVLGRTALCATSQPHDREPEVQVQEWSSGTAEDNRGILQINLVDSASEEVGAVKTAAEGTLARVCPKLGLEPKQFKIKIDPGAPAPEAPPGPCATDLDWDLDYEERHQETQAGAGFHLPPDWMTLELYGF